VRRARIAYLDSSVLVKRYVKEAGSFEAAKVMGRHRVATSSLAVLEIASALVRRGANLEPQDLEENLGSLREDERRWLVVEVTPSVVERAGEVIADSRLRCLDAIHVASAITLQREVGLHLLFVTADGPQRGAATKGGLTTLFIG
jgi:uncharacterized protein